MSGAPFAYSMENTMKTGFAGATFMIYLLFSVSQPLWAGPVALSNDNRGQALIMPVWTVEAGNDTLITLRNNSAQPTAVKVRLIRFDGSEVLAFNVYLQDDDSWTGALTATEVGAELLSRDESCVLPQPDVDANGLTRVDLSGDVRNFGHIEIVEMGINPTLIPGGGPNRWSACPDLAERFETGEWASDPGAGLKAPGGRISANVQLIDVADGGMISVPSTALVGFTDIVQHTPPDSPEPNLSTAHDENTDGGATESRVCTSSGCRVLAWERPVEAVASVLMTTTLRGDVVVNPAIGALTDLVITRPLKRYEAQDDSGFSIESEAQIALFDREGAFIESQAQTVQLTPPVPPKATPIAIPGLETGDAVVAVSFNHSAGGDDGFQSPILGMSGSSAFSTDGTGFSSGHARIVFRQSLDQRLTSIEGDPLPGEAAIGIAVQQFTNGALVTDPATQSTVLSNYRSVEAMTRR